MTTPAAFEGASSQNELGVAALVIGIFAVVSGVLYFPIGVILGLVGIGVGIAGRRRVQRGEATNGRRAMSGLVLSVVGLLVAVAVGFLFGYIVNQANEKCSDTELSPAEQQQCLDDELD
jgi:hypothetical protein